MGTAQKHVCAIVGLVIVWMLQFPPWLGGGDPPTDVWVPLGYHWIGEAPTWVLSSCLGPAPLVKIDVTRLAIQAIGALVLGGIAFVFTGRQGPPNRLRPDGQA